MGLSCRTIVLFAFRWMLILDLIESSRVLMQQRDILYYTEKDLKRPEAKWSNMKQTQVMHLCVNGLCSNLSLALTAAQPRDSNGSSPPHLMWQKKSHYSTLSSFQETKPEFQLGDLYTKKGVSFVRFPLNSTVYLVLWSPDISFSLSQHSGNQANDLVAELHAGQAVHSSFHQRRIHLAEIHVEGTWIWI